MLVVSFIHGLGSQYLPVLILLLGFIGFLVIWIDDFVRDNFPYAGIPVVGKDINEWSAKHARRRWIENGKSLIEQGERQVSLLMGPFGSILTTPLNHIRSPFQIFGYTGPIIIIPPSLLVEYSRIEESVLSVAGFMKKEYLSDYHGMEPFGTGLHGDIVKDMVRNKLTTSIRQVAILIYNELNQILGELLPDTEEWTPIEISEATVQTIARTSALIFLGKPLCYDKRWLEVSIKYSAYVFKAGEALRRWPYFLRPFVYRHVPQWKEMLQQAETARNLIEPELRARRARKETARRAGEPIPSTVDSLEWIEELSQGRPFDVVSGQLFLSVAAIRNASILLADCICDIASHPPYIDLLRKEIITVVTEDGGFKPTSLYKLRLLDSCLKESQRLHPLGLVLLLRRAERAVTLSDGTTLCKGASVGASTSMMTDPRVWPNADQFDGHRFLRMREQPGQENRWQFESIDPNHIGFSYGVHQCPGRHFAATELKTILIHLIMRYDWKVDDAKSNVEAGSTPNLGPKARMQCKRRAPEIPMSVQD